MNKIVDIIKSGIKLTLTPAMNDKTGERLGFIPFELNSKMTASAFLAQWKREDATAPIISIRPMNIARAAYVAADVLGIVGGKAAYKLRSILEDTDIRAAVDNTDERAAQVAKISVDIRRAEKQAERSALVGVDGAKLENERAALAVWRSEYEGAKIALAAARKEENDLCAAKVAELFPTFHNNDENENK